MFLEQLEGNTVDNIVRKENDLDRQTFLPQLQGKATKHCWMPGKTFGVFAIGLFVNFFLVSLLGFVSAMSSWYLANFLRLLWTSSHVGGLIFGAIYLAIQAVIYSSTGYLTVLLLCKLSKQNRQSAAIILASAGAIVWLSFAAMIVSCSGTNLGSWLLASCLVMNAAAQAHAAFLVTGVQRRLRPELGQADRLPMSKNHIGEFENEVAALKQTNSLADANHLAKKCLSLLKLKNKNHAMQRSEPVAVLIDELNKQKCHDYAEEISRHYLRLIEKS